MLSDNKLILSFLLNQNSYFFSKEKKCTHTILILYRIRYTVLLNFHFSINNHAYLVLCFNGNLLRWSWILIRNTVSKKGA